MNTPLSKQSGMATLVFSLVILFTITLTTIFGARVGLLGEKMSNNDYRGKESMMAAESGMDAAIMALSDDITVLCPSTCTVGLTAPLTAPFVATIANASVSDPVIRSYSVTATVMQADPITIKIVSTGCVGLVACGGTASSIESTSVIEQYIAKTVTTGFSPAAPMVLAGNLSPAGTWYVVGKEGASIECPVDTLSGEVAKCSGMISIWNSATMSAFSGAAATCGMSDFAATDAYDDVYGREHAKYHLCTTDRDISPLGAAPNCYCWNGPSGKGSLGPYVAPTSYKFGADIVAPPMVGSPVANFPTDLFAYLFSGIPKTDWQTKKDAIQLLKDEDGVTGGRIRANCSAIDQNSYGIYWVTGECTLNNDVGTPAAPVMIVVQNARIISSGSVEGYGLIFGLNTDGSASTEFKSTGGHWYGGVVIDAGAGVSAGGFRLIFSDGVFDSLNETLAATTIAIVPGTWKDF